MLVQSDVWVSPPQQYINVLLEQNVFHLWFFSNNLALNRSIICFIPIRVPVAEHTKLFFNPTYIIHN